MSAFKIKVSGSIQLGHQRELIQEPLAHNEPPLIVDGVGPKHEYDGVVAPDGSSLGQALGFRLDDKNIGELRIKDSGLVTSFGIFGAPGAGKTVLLQHLLEQVL